MSKIKSFIESRKDMDVLNRWVLVGWSFVSAALSIAYGVKGIKGTVNIWVVLLILLSLNIPLLISFILHKKNNCTRSVGYLFPLGYGIALCAIMIISKTGFTFLYAIPMMLLLIAYNDFRIARAGAIMNAIICTAAYIINQIIRGQWSNSPDESTIYFVALIMVTIFSMVSTCLAQSLNENKLATVSASEQQTKEVISISTKTANTVQDHANKTTADLNIVLASATNVDTAMQETINGMESARQIIDAQLTAVRSIEDQTDTVNKSIADVETEIKNSNREFSVAETQVNSLIKSSEDVLSSSAATIESMKSMSEIVENVTNIISIITHISGQTRLLSLNASIEAARAGAQGKGFAVVAGQIGKLAEQTNDATVRITEMIEKLEMKFAEMNGGVEKLVSAGELQVNSINEVNNSFLSCRKSMDIIESCSQKQTLASLSLTQENKKLSSFIEELSAMDEEVYASAVSTSEIVRDAKEAMIDAKEKMLTTSTHTKELINILSGREH